MPDPKSTVRTPSSGYETQEGWRSLPRLLLGGTRELRKGENAARYLPPEEDEETGGGVAVADSGGKPYPWGGKGTHRTEWEIRVGRSVIYPFFKGAVQRAVGAIFAKPIVLAEDVPPEIRGTRERDSDAWWENADLEGNDGNVYFSRVADDSLGDAGVSYTLVEHQRVPARDDGAEATDADLGGLRPYLVHIRACKLLNPDSCTEVVNGRRRFKLVRLLESYSEPGESEWERETHEQVRVLRAPEVDVAGRVIGDRQAVEWEIHRKVSEGEGVERWEVADSGTMAPHTEIPLVPYYTGYLGPCKARTPFDDLAYLNMLHTQRGSDIEEDFRVSLGAQMHRSGVTEEEAKDQRAIGAKRLLVSQAAEAKAEWLERTASAAKVAMESQDRLEARMLALSHEPHIRRTGTETATGRAIDAAEAKTETQAWAIAMRDHIESVLMFMAAYRGHETGGSVEVVIPPRHSEKDIEGLQTLVDMHVKTGAPSLQAILGEAKRQGWLPDDLDSELEAGAATASLEPGPEGRMRTVLRPLMERMGMSAEEIDEILDGGEGVE